VKAGVKELAEAMAAEGVEPPVIKRVLLNLGFSQDEATRAVARACIVVGKGQDEQATPSTRRAEQALSVKKEEASAPMSLRELGSIQRRLSILESRVAALIDLLSEYVPAIIEKVRTREPCNEGVRSRL